MADQGGGMKLIKPTLITDAMLTTAPVEPIPGMTWNAGTNYLVDALVERTTTHRRYKRKVAGTTATAPESDTVNWADTGPSNRWAMFDRKVGTITTTTSSLSVVLRPGSVSGLSLLELVGRQAVVTMKDAPAGTTVYNRTVSLDGTVIGSFFEWFFTDYVQLTDFVLVDLPAQFTSCELTVAITATTTVSCGVCAVGQVVDLGGTLSSATVGIVDYSVKTVDTFGNIDVVQRSYSKRNSLKSIAPKSDFNRIFRTLASLRATPCVYIGTEMPGYEPMIVYGFYKEFSIDVSYPTHHLCNLEIEGLI
ncbi:hypothetical protein [Undibacterium sp. Di24W]|uniref:hypothetical protein n=1 Tax=Undibacterium sp. Di24W TaxID=3413033 RepID=UPI003BF1F605